jgi:hypothetical protein
MGGGRVQPTGGGSGRTGGGGKMNGHTPGPWRIGNAGKAIFAPDEPRLIADLAGLDNARANARLIKEAPRMLELLKLTQVRIFMADGYSKLYQDIEAILIELDSGMGADLARWSEGVSNET